MADSSFSSGKRLKRKDRILKAIHPMIIKILAASRSYDLQIEGTIPYAKPCIFIANHYCVHDIPTACEVIGKHTYVLVSDEDKNTLNGLALSINGIIWVHRLDKEDRKPAHDDMLSHLKAGYNLLIYPEATWNLTAELPMLPMNWGVIRISKEASVPICPIYVVFTEKVCHARIGELFTPNGNDADGIRILRDRMATLFWDILEKQPIGRRANIPPNEQERSIAARYNEYARARKDPAGVRAYESQFIFTPKGQVTSEEAFSDLANIEPSLRNAFLFNKRLVGYK